MIRLAPIPAVVPVPTTSDIGTVIPFLDLWSDRQDVFPDDYAMSVTHNVGWTLGVAAGPSDFAPLAGYLLYARVPPPAQLCATAARMMGMTLAGLRGFIGEASC